MQCYNDYKITDVKLLEMSTLVLDVQMIGQFSGKTKQNQTKKIA